MGFFKRKKGKRKINEKLSTTEKRPRIEQIISEEPRVDPDFSFKVLLIGHNDSGKISSLESFGNTWFKDNTRLTLGISFDVKEIEIESLNIKLQIWDLATEERWKTIVPFYCRGALGAILIFDISESGSLYELIRWNQIIKSNTRNIPIILLGTLDDLNRPRKVSAEEAINFVRSEGLNGYFESNISKGEKLEHVFESLTRLIISNYEKIN